ncbi:DNA polymerase III subunit gamma and tau [uncultured Nocardioides sp.]|uniref:DNA polymerase III subunit gamma/tau n=1 Tax=uncultured Nocardioides sp. TaxID=198441 RepID=A0A6J4PJC1_9ACTN|nr:DNA polymerase III subunit gamma and tau [uncultured Nocardioides sp.]CAA9417093.1 MAG: DNA polymerase III subunits gamma and tau [uncultured Nocardioides sp.]
MDSPLALYRRYRPETFAQVIGQDHVTGPLRNALRHDRVNHAYLFSGPRGCGKTTSARILARSLNCAQAPVADPCGECDSCRELATGGSGSIDVIEIDAASHGGVDDARDLREKAFFAPVRDRYKIYIIDEAHMVSPQGFNALLKLVEEPPAHLRFIFATTEPEKVLPTIRSRTHHYPFRLIPPRMLSDHLSQLCESEGVAIEPAALPLVVRAGGGSARDTLSVLDQLMGGAGQDGVTHELATALLGFTPDTLLDEVIDAFAAADGAAVFGVVDKVVETGQDPRRFTEDLLRRLRDLVVVAAVPDAPVTGLIDVPRDQGERLTAQAARFGAHDLSRAADLVAAGLTEMRGATAPRLLLELICARVLLPGADHTTDGVLARLDRLEKRASIVGTGPTTGATTAEAPMPAPRARPEPEPVVQQAAPPQPASEPAESERVGERPAAPAATPAEAVVEAVVEAVGGPSGGLSLVDVRRLWPDIVEATKLRRRVAWMHLTQNSQVLALEGRTLTLGFTSAGARDSFVGGGCDEILRQAAIDVVGADWKVEAIVDPGAQPTPAPTVVRPATGRPPDPTPAPEAPERQAPTEAPDWARDEQAPVAPRSTAPTAPARTHDPESVAAAREAILATRTPGAEAAGEDPRRLADAAAHPDDPDADTNGLAGTELLQRTLGAQVIEEIPHT